MLIVRRNAVHLHFSRSRDPKIETSFRTHWVSPELSEAKRERLAEKASRGAELVVVQPLNAEWTYASLRRHQ